MSRLRSCREQEHRCSRRRSDREHWPRRLAVAADTGHDNWRLRADSTTTKEAKEEAKEEQEEEEEEEKAEKIFENPHLTGGEKTNNPHLTGGEQLKQ